MKALFQGAEYVIIEDDGDSVLLEPVDGDEDQRITVPYSDPTLIIDPTDGELDAAKAWRENVPKRRGQGFRSRFDSKQRKRNRKEK